MKKYQVNEIFYSVQGEGYRTGEPSVFVRLSKCNMRCAVEPGPRSPGGFDCDTEFETGRWMAAEELIEAIDVTRAAAGAKVPGPAPAPIDLLRPWVILTGGEPALQVDEALLIALRPRYRIAIETNGSIALQWPHLYDWIVVSPKVATHAIRQPECHELRLVRATGQELPEIDTYPVRARHYMVSPAFFGDQPDREAVSWAQSLVLRDPRWSLSVQSHKLLGAR